MDFNKSFYELSEEEYDDMDIAEWYDTYKKYKKLEEEIGCPPEVKCKIVERTFIYDIDGHKWNVIGIMEKHFFASCPVVQRKDTFNWYDYKKTWWLKADKSE